jgi:23S rRNA pseudouridine1911/1915/1917 synthase
MRNNRQNSSRRRQHEPRSPKEVNILYEDEAVVALNKPAGLPAVPVAKNSNAPSAWSLLKEELKGTRNRPYPKTGKDRAPARERAFVVHRIDRFTSGVLLFAKTQRDRDVLVQQFLEHTTLREYVAVVRGRLERQEGSLVHYFRKEGQHQALSSPRDKKAARAELEYKVERTLRDASVVRVKLITGLQNQIRVQLSAIGHPVIGDRKYHPAEADEKRIDRVALHATRLGFVHPRTGKLMEVSSEVPYDLRNLIRSLAPRTGN